MKGALIMCAVSAAVNLVGWLASRHIDRVGLPKRLHDRFVERKPNALPPRMRRIMTNLIGQHLMILIGFTLLEDHIPVAWPGLFTLAVQSVVLLLADDFGFYWGHRLMHRNRTLYRRVHKIHHEAYAPVPIEYFYNHPLEPFIGSIGLMPGLAAVYLIWGNVPLWTFMIYFLWRVGHELVIHSGAWLPTRHLPLVAPMRHHDLHHARPHAGNYGSTLLIWDRVFGTRVPDDRPAPAEARPTA
ncbi:MAG: sterol desaturase family protein [Myxococcales bacterium]|nr:sterol desaturase family protein [Myxococcales bacterium]